MHTHRSLSLSLSLFLSGFSQKIMHELTGLWCWEHLSSSAMLQRDTAQRYPSWLRGEESTRDPPKLATGPLEAPLQALNGAYGLRSGPQGSPKQEGGLYLYLYLCSYLYHLIPRIVTYTFTLTYTYTCTCTVLYDIRLYYNGYHTTIISYCTMLL